MSTLPAHAVELPYLPDVFVLLIASLVVVVALHRLKISPVLGYFVAGIAIGPAGLAIIGQTDDIRILAEFGVVFLLFLIGLELSWQRLRTMHRLVFGLGGLQVGVTATAIALIAWAWGNAPEAALIFGLVLALSSTAVVVQLLIERGEIASKMGRVSFAILIFQDLAVVPLLVLVPALATGAAGQGAPAIETLLLALVKATAVIALIVLAGRFLLRRPFRWVAATRSSELFLALVLLVVLGTGWLTQVFGLSMALGAFLAGLALAETEYRHQVETDIKPFKGLLLGLFFISIGMSIDLALIADQAFWIVASVGGLVIIKAAILTGLGVAFHLPFAIALRTGLLLGAGGEFAFVVVSAAMAAAVIPDAAGHFILAVTGLSMLLTPGLAWLGESASRRLEGARAERNLGPEDLPAEDLDNHVLIAGFGRVGQTVATMLEGQKVPYVAIDLDAEVVKENRNTFGRPVYFGDATRRDLLDRLGAARAAAFVITLDDPGAAKRVVSAAAARDFGRVPTYQPTPWAGLFDCRAYDDDVTPWRACQGGAGDGQPLLFCGGETTMLRSVAKNTGLAAMALAGVLASDAVLAAQVDGPKVQWNFNMYGPKRAASAGFEELARLIKAATDNNFDIKIHYGEALGPSKEALDAISIGAYEMTFACSGYTPGKLPTIDGMGLPFLPTPTIHHVRAMREAYMAHPVPQRDVSRWGAVAITPMPVASNEFLGKGKPPKALSDFKGMRVRALGGEADAMRLVGAVPTNLPAPEIYQGMERGLLDASSTLYYAHASYKTQEVANWYTTNLSLSSAPCLVFAGTKAFSALPAQYRKLMMDSVPASNDHWVKVLLEDDLKAVALFKAKGLTPVTFAESDLDNLRQQVRPIWDRWVAEMDKLGHNGKELLQLMLESAQKAKVS